MTDRVGRLLPIRLALAASIVVASLPAAASAPLAIAVLVTLAAISYGSMYTPSMALASIERRSRASRRAWRSAIVNTAWAFGQLAGPTVSGALADSLGDPVPYVLGAVLCTLTLVATWPVASGMMRPDAA